MDELSMYWSAVGLYDCVGHHVAPCLAAMSLADRLKGKCPKCGGVIVAGPDITPERASEMLRELKWRRWVMGLSA